MKRINYIFLLCCISVLFYIGSAEAITVGVTNAVGNPGSQNVAVDINLTNPTAIGTGDIYGIDLRLSYNSSQLTIPQDTDVVTGGLTSGWSLIVNRNNTGELIVVLFNTDPPLSRQTGTLVRINFDVLSGASAGQSPLTLTLARFGTFEVSSAEKDNGMFVITTASNHPPVLAAIGNKTIQAASTLAFSISASDVDGDAMTYSCTNRPTGATFSGQLFSWTPTASQVGTYNVSFQVTDSKSATDSESITITVTSSAPATHTITATVSPAAGGTISPSGSVTVNDGASQDFTITAASGYYIQTIAVDNASVYSDNGLYATSRQQNFSNVTANHTIQATFSQTPQTTYTITATREPTAGGTISPSGSVTVNQGANQDFNIAANSGYCISRIEVDGTIAYTSQGGCLTTRTHSFTNVTDDHSINAVFYQQSSQSINVTVSNAQGAAGAQDVPVSISVGALNGTEIWGVDIELSYDNTVIEPTSVQNVSLPSGWQIVPSNPSSSGVYSVHAYGITTPLTADGVMFRVLFDVSNPVPPGKSGSDINITEALFNEVAVTNLTNGYFTATNAAPSTYTITASIDPSIGGTISPSGSVTVNQGASQTFTITAASGYYIDRIIADSASVYSDSGQRATSRQHSFNNVTANHSIRAEFALKPVYHITTSVDPSVGGTISPSGSVNVNEGASQSFTITAASGYYIDTVIVDSALSYSDSGQRATSRQHSFNNVTANHSIRAEFAQMPVTNTYTITATREPSAGGSISPSGSVTVNQDASQTFTMTAASGYYIQSIAVNSSSVYSDSGQHATYKQQSITNVTSNRTIHAVFAQLPTPQGTTVTVSDAQGDAGDQDVPVSISVSALGGEEIWGIDIELSYDNTVIEPTGVQNVSLPSGWQIVPSNPSSSGVYSVHAYGITTPLTADGVMFRVLFDVSNPVPSGKSGSDIIITEALFNEVAVANLDDGYFTVTGTGPSTYTITATREPSAGGSISPSGSVTVNQGASQTFTMTAASGYYIQSIAVNSSLVYSDSGQHATSRQQSITNVTSNRTIHAVFAHVPAIQYTLAILTSDMLAGSTLPSEGIYFYDFGQTVSVTAVPNQGYSFVEWIIDEGTTSDTNPLTITINSDRLVEAVFAEETFVIVTELSPQSGGTINIGGSSEIAKGSSRVCSITPSAGYAVQDVKVNSVSRGAVISFQLSNVTSDQLIEVIFTAVSTVDEKPSEFDPSPWADYPYYLPMYGTVTIDGVELLPGDWVGVYDVDGNCYGAGQYRCQGGTCYYSLEAYMSDGSLPGFELYDEVVFMAEASGAAPVEVKPVDGSTYFYPDAESSSINPVEMNLSKEEVVVPPDEDTMTLKAGWNSFISTSVQPLDPSMQGVFGSALNKIDFIMDHQSWWMNGVGGNLTEISPYKCYYIKTNEACTFTVQGTTLEFPYTLTLSQGWNSISYPYQDSIEAIGRTGPGFFENMLSNIVWMKGEDGWCTPYINDIVLREGRGVFIKLYNSIDLTFSEN